MMKNKSIKMMVNASLVAALYTALTVALAPISYGNVQLRVAEALTIITRFRSNANIWADGRLCNIKCNWDNNGKYTY